MHDRRKLQRLAILAGTTPDIVLGLSPRVSAVMCKATQRKGGAASSCARRRSELRRRTTGGRLDSARRAPGTVNAPNGEATKWERELAEVRKDLRHGAQKGHKLVESTRQRTAKGSVTSS